MHNNEEKGKATQKADSVANLQATISKLQSDKKETLQFLRKCVAIFNTANEADAELIENILLGFNFTPTESREPFPMSIGRLVDSYTTITAELSKTTLLQDHWIVFNYLFVSALLNVQKTQQQEVLKAMVKMTYAKPEKRGEILAEINSAIHEEDVSEFFRE